MIESVVITVFILCAWFLIDAHFEHDQEDSVEALLVERPWRNETAAAAAAAAAAAEAPKTPEQETTHSSTRAEAKPPSATWQHTTMLTHSTAAATPSPSLPDRIVVMAKLPTDDTDWVHIDLPDWQSAIYEIDTETPHNKSSLDPLTNSTLRRLRNKGREANAYLAYIVQNYNNLPSTIAFIHSHKDSYPTAWHTDNDAHSNALSLQTLNIAFIQRNGYANLRPQPRLPARSDAVPRPARRPTRTRGSNATCLAGSVRQHGCTAHTGHALLRAVCRVERAGAEAAAGCI